MKVLFVLILTGIFYLNSFAQKKNTEDPIYEENSKSEEPINKESKNFSVETDEFTKINKVIQTQGLPLHQKGIGIIYSTLFKFDDKVICGFSFCTEKYELLCVNSECKVMVMLGNDNVITLNHIGKTECEKLITIKTLLSKDDQKIFSENQIEKIRCYTTEGYLDFELFEIIPKNYLNKKFYGNYIGANPKQVFKSLINEIQNL